MKPQIRIRTILIVTACIALGMSVSVRMVLNQPPRWKPYTSSSLQAALDQNNSVLITLFADWDSTTRFHERTAINSIEAFQVIRNSGLTTLRADATNADPAVMQLMKENGLISIPAFLLYSPAHPHSPIILQNAVSEEQLLTAIRYNYERSLNKALDSKDSLNRGNLR